VDAKGFRWQDRSHFLGISARLMRRVLVDHARARGYQKRGGGAQRVTLIDALLVAPESSLHLVDLDRALEALAAVDARKAKVVELRFFGGLSVEETADVLHVSNDTIKRGSNTCRHPGVPRRRGCDDPARHCPVSPAHLGRRARRQPLGPAALRLIACLHIAFAAAGPSPAPGDVKCGPNR
jgi:hypothetical protein